MAQEEQEQVLKGGNVNHIVRMSDTVRRPTGYWSPSVHRLLRHLEQQGFEGAPRFLGIDPAEREILTFIPGVSPGNDYPELEPYMWSDETLVGVARLLRRYHDSAQGLPSSPEDRWQLSCAEADGHEVICHNDAALYNIVFQDGAPAAWIDFDMAGPGPRIWDIAYTLYTSVPLASFAPVDSSTTPTSYRSDPHAGDRCRRIRLFFDSYGMPAPADWPDWIIRRLRALCDTLSDGAEQGNPAFVKMVEEGHLAHYESEIRFVQEHAGDWMEHRL